MKIYRRMLKILTAMLLSVALVGNSALIKIAKAMQLDVVEETPKKTEDDTEIVTVNDIILPDVDVVDAVSLVGNSVPRTYMKEQLENQQTVIHEETTRIRLEQEAAIQAEAARIAQIESITANTDNVSLVSNMTEEQYYIATKDTWWEGREQVLMDLERRYGINAFFAMAVSTLESGHGTSPYSKKYNRFYGEDTSPAPSEGLYDSTMYFGDFINRLYIDEGLTDVWSIGPKYCPPNRNWEVYVYNKMNELYNKVMSTVR